jgi:DNA polymerase III epsilon subunit family exonuclease
MINLSTQNLNPENKKILLEFFPQGIVALDLETTGLSSMTDKIIELACVKVTADETVAYGNLINPGIPIPPFTTKIHGITDEMVKDAPTVSSVLAEFLSFAGNLPIIAHNAQFDLGFIIAGLNQSALPVPNSQIFCSCKLSRKTFPEMPNHKLSTLAEKLQIDLGTHHRAFDDAFSALQIFAKALAVIKDDREKLQVAHIYDLGSFGQERKMAIPAHLEVLREKMAAQETVEIKYNGGSFKNQFRPVKPVSFIPTPQGNTLYALCLKTDTYKSFYLDKILEVKEC